MTVLRGSCFRTGRACRWWLPVLGLLLTITGCARQPDDTIRFALAGNPATLDPRLATDAWSARVNRLLYRRLVEFDEQFRPVPSLADWERLAPRHYRFHLRPDRAPFHDGSRLTARDVAATYRSILEAGSASPHAGTLRLIRSVEVLGEDTLDFLLDRADPLFPGYLVIGILPAGELRSGRDFSREPLGNGPFRFDAWLQDGLRLLRNGDDQAVEFRRIGDPVVRVLKLVRGEVDLLQNDLPAELLDYLAQRPGLQLSRVPGSNFAYLGFNLADAKLQSLAVRRALALAIDRASIVDYVLGGAARPAAALLPPEHWAGNPGLEPVAYDPDAARALLRSAGYGDDARLELEFKTSTDPVRVRIATILQQQLAAVGVDVKLGSHDWGTFFGDIKAGNFQLYSLMWVGIKTPDIFRYAFHSSSLPPEGANRGRYDDAETDALIREAEQADSLSEQARIYRRLQRRLLETLPCVPLWYEDHVAVASARVSGYRPGNDGNYDALVQVSLQSAP